MPAVARSAMAIARTALFLTALFQAVFASTNSSEEERTHEDSSRDEVFWLSLVLIALGVTACVLPVMFFAQQYEETFDVVVVEGLPVKDNNPEADKKPDTPDPKQQACASFAASFRSQVACPNSIAVRRPNETSANAFAYFAAGSGACATQSVRPSSFA